MTGLKITDHVLEGENVEIVPCDKDSGIFNSGFPDTVVIHYTAAGSISSAVRTLTDPQVKASAHLVIGREGEIMQLVPFNKIAWHAGKSEYQGRKGMNHYSIGIELDNAGRLSRLEGEYVSWFGRKYLSTHVMAATHKNESKNGYWHLYSEEQIDCVQRVCELLRDRYEINTIVGHDDIAPGRKTDPGPAFPLDKLRQRVLETDRQSDEDGVQGGEEGMSPAKQHAIVTASALNIRSTPSASGDLVMDPLPQGTDLQVIGEKHGWLKVNVVKTGWVKKNFVRTM